MKWNELLRNVPKVTPNYNFGASSNISDFRQGDFTMHQNYQLSCESKVDMPFS